jgi:AraC-like DNA-binding protein
MDQAALFEVSNAARAFGFERTYQPSYDAETPTRPARGAVTPLDVAVAHSSSLVAAGLAAMLGRMPGRDVRLQEMSRSPAPKRVAPPQVVFGDLASLRRFREESATQPSTGAKFVLVVACNEQAAQASCAETDVDECLSIECGEDELFATVQRLVDPDVARDSATSDAKPSARPDAPRGGLAPGALRRVREYVEQHLSESVPTNVLARIAKLSLGHFNRAFRQSTGMSPHQYITRRRVATAEGLLEKTTRALAEIALDVGFADQSHFSRTFAAVTGETPSACRRRYR